MSKIIAISTNKGGVLKTSLVTNLAGALCEKKKNVLIIDTDNQANVLLSFGKNPDNCELTLYDVLLDGLDPGEAVTNVYSNDYSRIDVLPANDDMTFFEFDVLTDKKQREPFLILKNSIGSFVDQYDYVLIDTPPTLGLIQGNVLTFADHVLIPFQTESYSMRSLVKILKAITSFKEKYNPRLNTLGVVATLVDQRTTLHNEVLETCRKYCNDKDIKFFNTHIPKSVRFASSIAYEGLPSTLTDKKNKLVLSYYELLKELELEGL